LSETLAMPAALAVGGHGRKGSYRLKARKADSVGLHLRPFFVSLPLQTNPRQIKMR